LPDNRHQIELIENAVPDHDPALFPQY